MHDADSDHIPAGFIPEDKIRELLWKINNVLECKKLTLKQLQSLVGALAVVVKALPAGRAFSRRLYGAIEGVKKSIVNQIPREVVSE